jgi:hypothetical protein
LQQKGPLRIIDSTCLKMPASLASWAYESAKATQIKIHMRLLVLPKGATEDAQSYQGTAADEGIRRDHGSQRRASHLSKKSKTKHNPLNGKTCLFRVLSPF